MSTTKQCNKCKETKNVEEFYLRRSRKNGTARWGNCKACDKLYHRPYKEAHYKKNGDIIREKAKVDYHSNPEKYKAKFRRLVYGLSSEDIQTLLTQQNNKCAICGVDFSVRKFHIDHEHSTKKVRGLLCNTCNAGIGFFYDDPERMKKAAAYLETH